MATKGECVSARLARPSDYQEVMAMSKGVLNGFDCLPSKYFHYLQDKSCYCFVGESKGKVVGFSVLHVLDNGITLLSEANRLDKNYRNKGVFGTVMNFARPYVWRRTPTLAAVVHAALDYPGIDPLVKMCKEGISDERIVVRYLCLTYKQSVQAIERNLKIAQATYDSFEGLAKEVTLEEMKNILSHFVVILKLFPSGYFVSNHDGTPHRAWASNILDVTSKHYTLVSKNALNKTSAISFGYSNQVVFGNRYDVCYYSQDYDLKTFLSHILKHLKHAVEISMPDQSLGMVIQAPQQLDVAKARTALKPFLGMTLTTTNFARNGAFLFEKPLPLSPYIKQSKL